MAVKNSSPRPAAPCALDEHIAHMADIHGRVARGADAVELGQDFWRQYAKLQANFASGLEDLCKSRTARLETLFGKTTSEPLPAVDDAWKVLIGSLLRVAEQHKAHALFVRESAERSLAALRADACAQQLSKAGMAKKVLRDLKSEELKMLDSQRNFHECSRRVLQVFAGHQLCARSISHSWLSLGPISRSATAAA